MPLSPESIDVRLRKIEEGQTLSKEQHAHQDRELQAIKVELDEVAHMARASEAMPELVKTVTALHKRVDEQDKLYAVLNSQHVQCMKNGERDGDALSAIQKDLVKLGLQLDQLTGMKTQVDGNRVDIEALKIAVKALSKDSEESSGLWKGGIRSLVVEGVKVLVIGAVVSFLLMNGWSPPNKAYETKQQAEKMQHDQTQPLPDDAHDDTYKRKLEAHQKEDRLFQQDLIDKLQKKGIAVPLPPVIP
jgi:hypothetical protein